MILVLKKLIRYYFLIPLFILNAWIPIGHSQTLSPHANLVSTEKPLLLRPTDKVISSVTTSSAAACPTAAYLIASDTLQSPNIISNNAVLTCGASPFYIYVDKNNMAGGISMPCVLSAYNIHDLTFSANTTETDDEGNVDLLCLGPSAPCVYPIAGPLYLGYWGIQKIYLDPGQQHRFTFCNSSLTPLLSTVQLQDCWSGAPLTPVNSFSVLSVGNSCFTDTLVPNTDIGTASFSISPGGTAALTDQHNGICYINTASLSPGSYTVTYQFKPPLADNCPAITTTFQFSIAPLVISASSATICAGATATLTASGPAGTSFSWTPSSGLSNNTGSIVQANPTSTNTYVVTGSLGACSSSVNTSVNVNPLPSLSVNSPSICIGSTATLTAGGASSYTWNTGANSSTITATPTLNTSYTVSGTSSFGCINSATTGITLYPLPTLSLTSANICSGSTAILSAGGASSYTWSTGVNTPTLAVTPSVTTQYAVSGTSPNNCTNSATTTVTVTSTPLISVNSATICAGFSSTLTASGANTYTWSTGAQTPSILVNPSNSTTYTVNGSNSNSCSGYTTAVVSVHPIPVIQVNSAQICPGFTTTLTATGANSYTWSTGANTGTISSSPVSTTQYTVTGSNAYNCLNTAISTVSLNPVPSIQVLSTSICAGQTAVLTASGANSYTWNTGVQSSGISISPNSTTVYTVSGSNFQNCQNTATATVNVYPLPLITTNTASICSGTNSATLTANGALTYTWNTGSNNSSIIVSPLISTQYTVSGTDVNTCTNSSITSVSVIPSPTVQPISNPGNLCVGQSLSLSANSVSGAVYSWTGPNAYSSSIQNPVIPSATLSHSGVYTLSIQTGACSVSNTVSVTVDALPSPANAGKDTILYISGLVLYANTPLVGSGNWSVISGSGNFTNSTLAGTSVVDLATGTNILQWTITNGTCPASSDELIILVKSLQIPNGFSPNGDGINDYFEINGIELYTGVQLTIFNRWGNVVYAQADYKNNWNGKNMSGEDLSDDTYFYTLEVPGKENTKGYLVLKRK